MRFVICLRVVLGLFVAESLVGCATNPPQTPELAVMVRAQARWDALRAGQYDKAYSYLTPSTRATLTIEVFRGRIAGASWLDVKVVKAVCEPEVCDVSVKMDYYVLPNLRDTQIIGEKWILDGGKWWFVYRG